MGVEQFTGGVGRLSEDVTEQETVQLSGSGGSTSHVPGSEPPQHTLEDRDS